MIVVTGGAGFIGYNLVKKLIDFGHKDIVVVDNHISRIVSRGHQNITYVSVEDSYLWLGFNGNAIKMVYHLGARTDTMETDEKILNTLNINYSKFIWELCTDFQIPLIYASSAAVYGNGDLGFSEDVMTEKLQPLNQYGVSKLVFDNWVETRETTPPYWFGLRFFNVYGQHEDHKGRMASVIWHFYHQIKETGGVKLFRSHVDFCEDGQQKRDFVHVDDVVKIMLLIHQIRHVIPSNIYNLGTGQARTYNDLAKAIFKTLGKPENISYIDTPLEIRDGYQYYTRAKMDKLFEVMGGYNFLTLEQGIESYIKQLENENR